jgi:hypothetical protein
MPLTLGFGLAKNAAEEAASALSAMKSSREYSYRQKLFLV